MFAGSIVRLAKNTASISYQQVRFARNTFKLKSGYHGANPLTTTDEYEEAKEAGLLEELSYKEIRFPLPFENNSPLFDRDYERFCKYAMKGGRKQLANQLVHNTFFQIKSIQYNQIRKLKEKQGLGSLVTQEFIESHQNNPEIENSYDEEQKKIELNPMTILKTALENCEPVVMTKKIRRGGATYQVPYPLNKDQSKFYAIKWLMDAVLERPKPRKKQFPEVMAQELLDAYHNRGKVIKKRDDIHRLADANKAYAHYRWG